MAVLVTVGILSNAIVPGPSYISSCSSSAVKFLPFSIDEFAFDFLLNNALNSVWTDVLEADKVDRNL